MGQIYQTTLQKTTEAYNVTRNMLYTQEATVHNSPERIRVIFSPGLTKPSLTKKTNRAQSVAHCPAGLNSL